MTQSNADLLRTAYEAFARGDVAAVFAVFAEDIAFHAPGHSPISGDYTGHEEVGGFFGALGERSDGTFRVEVQDVLESGDDTVVALVTFVAQSDAAQLAMPGVHVWKVKDGKATSHVTMVTDDYEWDEFWS